MMHKEPTRAEIREGQTELLQVRKRSRALYWFVAIFSGVVNLLMLTGPLFMLNVYDRVLGSRSYETLVALSLLAGFMYLMMGILDYARGRIMGRIGAQFQTDLEERVLNALQDNLMDQDLLEVFCKEYAKERNRLDAEAEQGRSALEKELATANRDHSKLVDAIIAGIPADQVKDKMQTLTERREALEAQLAHTPAPDPIRIHPKMATTYQTRVRSLISGLHKTGEMQEAQEALRDLVDKIVLQPSPETGKLDIVLEGALSGLLTLALGAKRKEGLSDKTQAFDNIDELVLVAGVGFEPTTFRL